MRWVIFKNGEIRGRIVVLWLYRFSRKNRAILWVPCHSSTASVCGSFARHSRPVLGGAEGEIPSAYSTLKIRVFFVLERGDLKSPRSSIQCDCLQSFIRFLSAGGSLL